ncbi:phosphotransferase family protein [Alkalibacillus haloalkaliphilus]|uniref:Phosphotransferase n=1 Tax=Alkalibacillus haloalkaliphilus TaxID=94136 RepID=A0A511W5A0_9BACI|nr:phosphotransferase family protein [Alkalibacillus haloalkaliphilus]GEN45951.1 phosphotransferase [Alkalibacillus haloalkaliphilus]
MEQVLGSDWLITPAGGSSGEAYLAENSDQQKLFLKRNSSPFLAILSAEGIVPKLVWTKRLADGDVITAQKWLEGRVLTKPEMQQDEVVQLISKIHHSSEILHLFMRMGKKPLEPWHLLVNLHEKSKKLSISETSIVKQTVQFLTNHISIVENHKKVVCHADLNHENWLLGEDDHLYLIDWDNAVLADPAMDLSMLLYQYIPRSNWEQWLDQYGIQLNDHLLARCQWYMTAQSLSFYLWHLERGDDEEAEKWKQQLTSNQQLFIKY